MSPQPVGSRLLGVSDRFKDVLFQPLMPHRAVEAFNVAVLRRLPRLNEKQLDTLTFGPALELGTDVLRTVV